MEVEGKCTLNCVKTWLQIMNDKNKFRIVFPHNNTPCKIGNIKKGTFYAQIYSEICRNEN